jgi:hypothetical protein
VGAVQTTISVKLFKGQLHMASAENVSLKNEEEIVKDYLRDRRWLRCNGCSVIVDLDNGDMVNCIVMKNYKIFVRCVNCMAEGIQP